jgi:iron complex outermembrane receptor protein
MRRLKMKSMLWCSMAALPAMAHAQSAPTTEPATPMAAGTAAPESTSASDAGAIGEILVTAQRRSERLQDVAVAVTAIGPVMADKLGLRGIVDIAAVTPGASFMAASGGFFQPYIRGIGQLFVNPGLESPVAVYEDGAYLSRMLGITELLDNIDIGSIQVLRGPQGTLYGRNATGGVVLVNSADPTSEFEGKVRAEYGRFDRQTLEGVVNVPLASDLSLRVTGRYKHEGGYVKNVEFGNKNGGGRSYGARAKLRWQPEGADIILGLQYQDTLQALDIGILAQDAPTCYVCTLFGVTGTTAGYYEQRKNPQPSVKNKYYGATLKMVFDLGAFELTSLSNYRRQRTNGFTDSDFTTVDFFNFTIPTAGGESYAQDLQVASRMDGRFNYIFGLSYLKDRGFYDITFTGLAYAGPVATFGEYPRFINVARTQSYSAFVEGYFNVNDQIKLTAGGRYTYEDRKFQGITRDSFAALFGAPGFEFRQQQSLRAFTPRFVIAWDNGPTNIYYSYTRGFKAGGFAGPSIFQSPPVESEKIGSHEIGLKQSAMGGRLRFNVAAFYFKNKNLQTQSVDQVSGGVVTQNAGALENYGLELDTQYEPLEGLNLGFTAAWQHARYQPFRNASVVCFDPTGTLNAGAPGATIYGCAEDLTGRAPPNAPDWSGSVNAGYDFAIGTWSANLSALAQYRSTIDFFPGAGGPLRYDKDNSRILVNASGYVSPAGDNLRLGFYVNNLFNKKYPTYRQTSQPYSLSYEPGRPITYGARIQYSF